MATITAQAALARMSVMMSSIPYPVTSPPEGKLCHLPEEPCSGDERDDEDRPERGRNIYSIGAEF